MTGWVGFTAYFGLSTVLMLLYYSRYLRVDEEEFGGRGKLLMEGFVPAMFTFILSWTTVYTLLHG